MLEFKNNTFIERNDLAEWGEREPEQDYFKRLEFKDHWSIGNTGFHDYYLKSCRRDADGAYVVSVSDTVTFGLSHIYCENEAEFANLILKIAPLLSTLMLDSLNTEIDDALGLINQDRKRRGYSNDQTLHLSDVLRQAFEKVVD